MLIKPLIPFLIALNDVDLEPVDAVNSDVLNESNLTDIISKGIAYLIIIAAFLSILYIIWGGIRLIASGGKEEKVQEAYHTIRYALIGLVITILSFTIINLIGRIFNLELVKHVSFEQIVEIINNLFT